MWSQTDSPAAFSLAVGSLLLVVPVFCLGLIADLLSRIMAKSR
jgi:hypothetical protein